MTIQKFQVVTPGDLSTQFTFSQKPGESRKYWHVASGPSADADNLLTAGADGASFLATSTVKNNQITYELSLTDKKIKLINSDGGVSEIPTTSVEAEFKDVSITGSTVTFTDNLDSSKTYVADFSTFLTAVGRANSNSIELSGSGTATDKLTATLVVDPSSDNLLKVSVSGAMVDSADILDLLNTSTSVTLTSSVNTLTLTVNGQEATATIINSNALTVDSANSVIKSSVNGVDATAAAIQLVDSNDGAIGYAFA